jgi:hypothetical protein
MHSDQPQYLTGSLTTRRNPRYVASDNWLFPFWSCKLSELTLLFLQLFLQLFLPK